MEVHMVADMEMDKVADMVVDIGGRHGGRYGDGQGSQHVGRGRHGVDKVADMVVISVCHTA